MPKRVKAGKSARIKKSQKGLLDRKGYRIEQAVGFYWLWEGKDTGLDELQTGKCKSQKGLWAKRGYGCKGAKGWIGQRVGKDFGHGYGLERDMGCKELQAWKGPQARKCFELETDNSWIGLGSNKAKGVKRLRVKKIFFKAQQNSKKI